MKHGPNCPFYALILRTKLYQNPFFFVVHQNVNKSKNRAARTVYGPIFFPFYVFIIRCYSFSCQGANIAGCNCAIIGLNLSQKHKLALYKTQSGEPNYLDNKILFQYFARSCLYNNSGTDIQMLQSVLAARCVYS